MKKENQKRRVTITIRDEVSDLDALQRIAEIIKRGKISHTNGREHYTFMTVWDDGIFVESRPKYNTESDRFLVGRSVNYISVDCPECEKRLELESSNLNLFSCDCGRYKVATDILIKIKADSVSKQFINEKREK